MRGHVLVAFAALVALALSACAQPPARQPGIPAVTEATLSVSAPETGSPPAPPPQPGTSGAPSPGAPRTGEDAAPENGQHDCYVVGVDVTDHTVTVDYIQVFTGAQAEQAAKQADEQLPPGVQHYIRDTNPTTYTFPAEQDVELPGEIGRGKVYRVTIEDGELTGIERVTLP